MFWPVMKPALSAHRKAQASPNSSAVPNRPAGLSLARSFRTCSTSTPRFSDSPFAVLRRRSVSNGPGSRPLMVTLAITVLRDRPAMKPVRPARAPLERPSTSIGDFTAAEVMLTMRPNLRAIMSSRVQLRKSPGGGPPALLTRMSGSGQAFSTASRPACVVISPTISVTVTPGLALRISSAVCLSASAPRAVSVTWTPSLASAIAQARPSPLLDAQTMARRPLIPRSTVSLPYEADGFAVRTLATREGFGKGARLTKMHKRVGLEHDPDPKGRASAKCLAVFPRDKRQRRLRGGHAQSNALIALQAIDDRRHVRRQRAKALLPGSGKDRAQLR